MSVEMEVEKLRVEKEKLELEKRKLALEIQRLEQRASYTIKDDSVFMSIIIPYIPTSKQIFFKRLHQQSYFISQHIQFNQ